MQIEQKASIGGVIGGTQTRTETPTVQVAGKGCPVTTKSPETMKFWW